VLGKSSRIVQMAKLIRLLFRESKVITVLKKGRLSDSACSRQDPVLRKERAHPYEEASLTCHIKKPNTRACALACMCVRTPHEGIKFLLVTNLTHFFMYLFISSLYMFRASQCSSSGDRIVLIHHLVRLVCVSDCLVCRSGGN